MGYIWICFECFWTYFIVFKHILKLHQSLNGVETFGTFWKSFNISEKIVQHIWSVYVLLMNTFKNMFMFFIQDSYNECFLNISGKIVMFLKIDKHDRIYRNIFWTSSNISSIFEHFWTYFWTCLNIFHYLRRIFKYFE